MPDVQILNAPTRNGFSDYVLPGSVEFVLKTANALFTDNAAAGDWLPALVVFSDSGHVVARAVDTAVVVTAGDDAEVSWFPGVKHAGAGFLGLPFADARQPSPAGPYASGAVITPAWGSVGFSGGDPLRNSGFHATPNGAQLDLNVSAFGIYVYTAKIEWAAGFAGDRYIEVDVPVSTPMPQRFAQSGTPEGDTLVLSGVFFHSRAFDDVISVNIMQASGAPQSPVDVWLRAVEIPGGP